MATDGLLPLPSPDEELMTTPIDDAAAAQADFSTLLNATVPFAQKMIRKHGAFSPFGASMDPNGGVNLLGAGEGESAAAMVELLRAAARQAAAAGTARAVAICFLARVTPPGGSETSAIQAQVEHANGQAANVYFPFRKRLLRGYEFDAGEGVPCAPSLFTEAAQM